MCPLQPNGPSIKHDAWVNGFCQRHRHDADEKQILACGCERSGAWKYCPYCGKVFERIFFLGRCLICGKKSAAKTGKYCDDHKSVGALLISEIQRQVKEGNQKLTEGFGKKLACLECGLSWLHIDGTFLEDIPKRKRRTVKMTDLEIENFKTELMMGPHNRQLRASAYVKRLREQGLSLIKQLEKERKNSRKSKTSPPSSGS